MDPPYAASQFLHFAEDEQFDHHYYASPASPNSQVEDNPGPDNQFPANTQADSGAYQVDANHNHWQSQHRADAPRIFMNDSTRFLITPPIQATPFDFNPVNLPFPNPPKFYHGFDKNDPSVPLLLDASTGFVYELAPNPIAFPVHWPVQAVPSNQQFQGPEDVSSRSSPVNEVEMEDLIPLDNRPPSPVDSQAGRHLEAMVSGSRTQNQSPSTSVAPVQPPAQLDPNTRCRPTTYSQYNHQFAPSVPYTAHPNWVLREIFYHVCQMPGCGELVLATDSAKHCERKKHYKECKGEEGCPWDLGKGKRCGKKGLGWGEHFSRTHFKSGGGWCTCCGHFFPTRGGYVKHVLTEP